MNLVLFDSDDDWKSFLPFTHIRPIADIRCGILTMRERWEILLKQAGSGTLVRDELKPAFPVGTFSKGLLVNGRVFCTERLAAEVLALKEGEKLSYNGCVIAVKLKAGSKIIDWNAIESYDEQQVSHPVDSIDGIADIFSKNEISITRDFELLRGTNHTHPEGVTISGTENVFIHPEAKVAAGVIINAKSGPVYIAAGSEIMEGCLIRGPFALCDGATLKMGTKVYGGTTIGPGCKVGGEVSNVVFFANSNKGHDGFLGNAVIGEWCNLGADTNCSNLKNNYDEVKIWDEAKMKSVKTGLTFCGLLMGDHSKCGINTMFNTGTVVGVSCNIWGGGFPEKFVPSFSWGGSDGMTTYSFERATDTANRMMARRGRSLSTGEIEVLKSVFEKTKGQRALLHHT